MTINFDDYQDDKVDSGDNEIDKKEIKDGCTYMFQRFRSATSKRSKII